MEYYLTKYNLLGNLLKNFEYVRADFTGVSFHANGFMTFVISFAVSLFLILLFYLLGKQFRLRVLKFTTRWSLTLFLDIALGYILVGSGVLFLGLFSLLYTQFILLYLALLTLLAFSSSAFLKQAFRDIVAWTEAFCRQTKKHRWLTIAVLTFILIAFLRLVPPEIREDALGYHTDHPRTYLKEHTMILPSKEQLRALPVPQLGEMVSVISQSLSLKEVSRHVHFLFYLLIILILYSKSFEPRYRFARYGAFLFATAPEVIRATSSSLVDFQWIFCFLVMSFLIAEIKNTKSLVTAGALLGGVLATKLWTIAYIPVPLLFLIAVQRKLRFRQVFKRIFLFLICAFIVAAPWYVRSYLITGNPVYPAFRNEVSLEGFQDKESFSYYFQFNKGLIDKDNIRVFSPLFYFSLIFFLLYIRRVLRALKKNSFSLIFLLFSALHIIVNYPYGRYLMGVYAVASFFVSSGTRYIMRAFFLRSLFVVIYLLMVLYYFTNLALTLPYGLGWADQNKYLTRILSRDDSSYYDFDRSFNKYLTKDDLVATYRIFGFYYADFNYIDIPYIITPENRSFDLLKKYGATKLFIRGGDITWFCRQLKLTGCQPQKFTLHSQYHSTYYLYSLK